MRRKRKKKKAAKSSSPSSFAARAPRTWKPGHCSQRFLGLWQSVPVPGCCFRFDSGCMFMRQVLRLLVCFRVFYVNVDSDPATWTLFCALLVSGTHLFGVCLAQGVQENWNALGDDFRYYSRLQRCWFDSGYTLTRQSTEFFF